MEISLNGWKHTLKHTGLLYLPCRVIPKSQKTELMGIFTDENHQQVLKIRLNAPPEKGKANKELCTCLAETFNVPKRNVSITSGQTSRTKLIKIIAE